MSGKIRSAINARQIKAARALLDWSQERLAEVCGLSIATIRKIESGHISPRNATMGGIQRELEGAGLEFIDPSGVRLRPEDITVYQGREGFLDFFDDVYQTSVKKGGEIVVVVASEKSFEETRGIGELTHINRMDLIKDRVSVKCIVTEDKETLTASSYCEYRWISKHYVDSVPFYVYDDKYAAIIFDADPSPKIIVIQSRVMAQAFRKQFHSMWDKATPLNTVKKIDPAPRRHSKSN